MRQHRTQLDDDQDTYSYDSGIDFTGTEDLARQEFFDETEISTILRRHPMQAGAPMQSGEVDQTTTLHDVFMAAERLRERYTLLPEQIRKRYRSWSEVIAAAERGELTDKDLEAASAEKVAPAEPAKGEKPEEAK